MKKDGAIENRKDFLKQPKTEYEIKKTRYFANLAQRLKSAFAIHQKEGNMWKKEGDNKRNWGNVSEHCLVEVARTNVLADLLDLSAQAKKNLMYAAALHDFSKRREKELSVPKGGITWEQYDREISGWSKDQIRKNGFSEQIAELSEAVGHGSLLKIEEILKELNNLTEEDLTCLAMHYVDAYTVGSEWVAPSDGVTNEINMRTQKNKDNPTLSNLHNDGRRILGGRDYDDVMLDVCRKIEILFVQLIKEKKDVRIDPLRLPEYIDEQIKREILL